MDPLKGRVGRVRMGPGGEFDLIRRLVAVAKDGGEGEEAPGPGVLLGPGDDCALLEGGWAVSADLSVEGIHFRREWITMEEAGFRAASAALSDLAAVAAEPVGILFSMALDPSRASDDAPALQRGASEACRSVGAAVLGGDLAETPGSLVMDVVVLGRTEAPVLRAGAKVGDEVWVTGWLGGSAGAVSFWKGGQIPPQELRAAFARPSPRIQEARWLAARVPLHAAIDLSDGLGGDAGHIAVASDVAIVLKERAIPFHPGLKGVPGGMDPLRLALSGGEDFELCFTAPPKALDDCVDSFQDTFGVSLTNVGFVREGEGLFLETATGEERPLSAGGFSHFLQEEAG